MTTLKPNPLNYTLGLDIGITSVGWAMVETDDRENPARLIDLGVRVFERAGMLKTRDPLVVARCLAHSVRRLAHRRACRLFRTCRLLRHEDVLKPEDFDENGLVRPLPYMPKRPCNTPW